ncbi:MAG: SPOR domain-containing protein, partial [Bacteroidetes bacterium]|nr:SPOR domain-containing protein [Bacteroidota bacterium]
ESYVEHSFLASSDIELHSKEFILVRLRNFKAEAFSTAVSTDKNLFAPRNQKGFYIITGCFEFYENATNYISSLRSKGLNAIIVDQKNGLFRISASSSKNRADALRELNQIKSSGFKDAWILSK